MKAFLDKELTEYKCLPTYVWDAKCFACGKDNPESLKMKFYTDEESVFSRLTVPENKRGWDQLVHGGIISTILDEIMAWTAMYMMKDVVMTKNLAVKYLRPVYIEKQISTVGWVHERKGPREVVLKAEIYDDKKRLCTKAVGNFAIFPREAAKRLKLMDEESLSKFKKFIEACHS